MMRESFEERTNRWMRRMQPGALGGRSESVGPPILPLAALETFKMPFSRGGKNFHMILVAAADADEQTRTTSDYLCTGTDDQDTIQQALDALATYTDPDYGGFGIVMLSGGNFYCSGEFHSSQSNGALVGQSQTTTFIRGAAPSSPLFTILHKFWGVARLTFAGDFTGPGIRLGADGVEVAQIDITDCGFLFLHAGIDFPDDNNVDNLSITHCLFNGINNDNSGDCAAIDGKRGGKGSGSGDLNFVSYAAIHHNQFGLFRDPETGSSVNMGIKGWAVRCGLDYGIISSNLSERCGGGFCVNGSDYSVIANNVIQAWFTSGFTTTDEWLIDPVDFVVNGDGVQIGGGSFGNIVANNNADTIDGAMVSCASFAESLWIIGNNAQDAAALFRMLNEDGSADDDAEDQWGLDISIVGNFTWYSYGPGVFTDDGEPACVLAKRITNLSIHGNHFKHTSSDCIILDDTSWAAVVDNHLNLAGVDDAHDRAGIRLTNDANSNFISANHIVDDQDVPPVNDPFQYAVWIDNADCDDNVIAGNDVRGSWTILPIGDSGTGTMLTYPNDPTYGDNFT